MTGAISPESAVAARGLRSKRLFMLLYAMRDRL
jgi:hypothetical protein